MISDLNDVGWVITFKDEIHFTTELGCAIFGVTHCENSQITVYLTAIKEGSESCHFKRTIFALVVPNRSMFTFFLLAILHVV